MNARGASSPSRYRTKVDLAFEGLQQAILTGVIKPGERLTIAQLSEQLEMSSTPIREAIRLLEADGVITNKPHRGSTVATITPEEAEELYLIRAPVESLATKLATPHLTDADLERLDELHREMAAAVESGDDEALTRANASWHLYIYSTSKATYLPRLILRLWMPVRWGGLWVPERREQAYREHTAILQALRARDAETASRLMFDHIDGARDLIVTHLRELDSSPVAAS
jgi:DNA-binding GntR family transcriptional regulator